MNDLTLFDEQEAPMAVAAVAEDEASLNVTWAGQNGNLPDPIPFNSTNREVMAIAQEAIRAGDIPGINADRAANLEGFVIDKFAATEGIPFGRIVARPSTPFG